MGTETDPGLLSSEERVQARRVGVHEAFAEHLDVDPTRLHIRSSRNVEVRTVHGPLNFMEVKLEYTHEGVWHWRNLRFNGELDIDLAEEHMAVLGSFALRRDVEIRDYSRDAMGWPLRKPEIHASVVDLDIPEYVSEPAEARHPLDKSIIAA